MESRENKEKRRRPREALASILFAGSVLCVMLWMLLCGGCQAFGRSGGLPVPGTLSGQGVELNDINGKLYDHLQILLWVGRNNYDCGGDQRGGWKPENGKPEMRSYRFGNGLLGNRRLRNYDDSGSCKSGKGKPGSSQPSNGDQGEGSGLGSRKSRNHDVGNNNSRNGMLANGNPRNHDPRNGDVGNHKSELRSREMGMKALDGCMEIVGLPDGNEMLLANNINREGVDRLVRDAMALKARKEKLVGRMGKDVALLEKRYASYESSHRTLRTLQVFGGLVCTIVVVFCLVFFRLR